MVPVHPEPFFFLVEPFFFLVYILTELVQVIYYFCFLLSTQICSVKREFHKLRWEALITKQASYKSVFFPKGGG